MQLDVLRRRAFKISTSNGSSANKLGNELRLISHTNFKCSGTLTSLLLGVDVRTVINSRNAYPEVQIWRRSLFLFRRKEKQEIRIAAGDFSPDGVLVYNLTPPMQFQSGDMLGVYQPQQSASVVRLYYNVNDSAPDTIRRSTANPPSLILSTVNRRVTGQNILLSPIIGIGG